MSDDFTVTGADDFYRLSKALKAAGRGDLRKELNKALRNATKPLIRKTRQAALDKLPQRGGLARSIAKAPQRVQVRTGQQTAGVRIVGKGASLDRGRFRHPVFGNREVFVEQTVEPGWFSETLAAGAPEVRPEIEQALESIAQQIVREAGQ